MDRNEIIINRNKTINNTSLVLTLTNVILLLFNMFLTFLLLIFLPNVRLFTVIFGNVLSLVLFGGLIVSTLINLISKQNNSINDLLKENISRTKLVLVSHIILYSYIALFILFGIALMVLSICL